MARLRPCTALRVQRLAFCHTPPADAMMSAAFLSALGVAPSDAWLRCYEAITHHDQYLAGCTSLRSWRGRFGRRPVRRRPPPSTAPGRLAIVLWIAAAFLLLSTARRTGRRACPRRRRPARHGTATSTPEPTAAPTAVAWLGRVVFPSERSGNLDLWVMDIADPDNPVQLTTHLMPDVEPVWPPDGASIVFSRGQDNEPARMSCASWTPTARISAA